MRKRALDSSHLNLAPMIDIFTVLLIFLLVAFLADEKTEEVSAGIKLPESSASFEVIPKLQIQILKSQAELKDGSKFALGSPELYSAIEKNYPIPPAVLIVADRSSEFRPIKSLVAELTKRGYSEFQFLTKKGGED